MNGSSNSNGRALRWLPWLVVAAAVVVGLFAPLLANDVPLVASVDGHWRFPAFQDLLGEPPPPPADDSWKQWWSRLRPDDQDWAWMPPWPYGPLETDVDRVLQRPCFEHPFGSDDTGRDVLARIVHGAATAIGIGLPAVLVAGLFGSLLGAWAGFARGAIDVFVQRLIELALCFPSLLFLLFAASFFGRTWFGLAVTMALLFWIGFARIVRGELLSLRERDFVLVARGLGVSTPRLLLRHMLPQLLGQIGVTAAFYLAGAIVIESTMSFLGIGPIADSSWGEMVRQGTESAALGAWHLWLFPSLAIVALVLACHALTDRVRARPSG